MAALRLIIGVNSGRLILGFVASFSVINICFNQSEHFVYWVLSL